MTRPYTIGGRYGHYTEAEIAADQAARVKAEHAHAHVDQGDEEEE